MTVSSTMSVYRERAHLVAFLTTVYPSVGAYNDPVEPEFCIVYVETPAGQMSWHICPDDMDLFEGLPLVDSHVWDGHSTEEKYRRLRNYTQIRRMPEGTSQVPDTKGRRRLDGLLAGYDVKVVAESLRA